MHAWIAIIALTYSVLTPIAGGASIQLDQYATGFDVESGFGVDGFAPIGQTFTPLLNGINFADFALSDDSSDTTDGSVIVELFKEGIAKPLSASAPLVVSRDDPPAVYQFNFSSVISLDAGSVYSLLLVVPPSSQVQVYGDTGTYDFGNEFDVFNDPGTGDLYFAEGIQTQSVPEPEVFLSGMCSIAIFVARRQRCRPSR